MASETQYNLFKFMYEEQQTRAGELVNRGKIYLSISTVYLGFLAFKGSEFIASEERVFVLVMYLISSSFFVGSLLFTIRAIGIFRYEIPTLPIELIENAPPTPPTDDEFREDRMIDFAVATDRNFKQNENRATNLFCSSLCLFGGVALHLLAFLISIIASLVADTGG